MRIIKAAKKTEEFTDICENCGSVLGIRRNDLNNYTHDTDDACEEWVYYCGVCQAQNHVIGKLSELLPWIMEDENEIPRDNTVRINSI